eukprot:1423162-Pyramimonas_sp.AAC.1
MHDSSCKCVGEAPFPAAPFSTGRDQRRESLATVIQRVIGRWARDWRDHGRARGARVQAREGGEEVGKRCGDVLFSQTSKHSQGQTRVLHCAVGSKAVVCASEVPVGPPTACPYSDKIAECGVTRHMLV